MATDHAWLTRRSTVPYVSPAYLAKPPQAQPIKMQDLLVKALMIQQEVALVHCELWIY